MRQSVHLISTGHRMLYTYQRRRDLPWIIRVPTDWLASPDPAITDLITERLERALSAAPAARRQSLIWALEGERQAD